MYGIATAASSPAPSRSWPSWRHTRRAEGSRTLRAIDVPGDYCLTDVVLGQEVSPLSIDNVYDGLFLRADIELVENHHVLVLAVAFCERPLLVRALRELLRLAVLGPRREELEDRPLRRVLS